MMYSLALVVFACMFYYTTSLHNFCTTFRLCSYINIVIFHVYLSTVQNFAENGKYRVRQKYLTISQNSCKWNRRRGEFVLERSSNETQSISVAMERWSVEHWVFTVETIFINLTQRIFRRQFNIHWYERP
jgi:hypothetical protein